MKKCTLSSLLAAVASAAMGDVVLPGTASIADIQSAIDAAQPGDVITLADGTYNVDQTLYVTNGVTLTGSSRDACLLVGDGAMPLATAIVLDHADACAKNLTVSNITTTTAYNYTGVGVQIKSGLLTQARVTGCKSLAANNTANRTAGVSLEGADAVMTHCLVDHNEGTAGSNLGGVRIHKNGGTMANCLIWANVGVNAGGVSVAPDAWQLVKVVNCTVVGNTATTRGGGIANEAYPSYFWYNNAFYGPVIVNTVISGNTAPSGADLYFGFNDELRQNETGFNCLCPTAIYGTNPQTGDPLFVSPETGDFHLQSGSAARNAGDAAKAESVLGSSLAGTLDFYGLDRILESAVDIGCAEFDPSQVSCSIVKGKDPVFAGETVTLAAAVSGFDDASDIEYLWTVKMNGSVVLFESCGAEISLELSELGTCEASLTVSSAQLHRSVDSTTSFNVFQSTIYVTSKANPGCAYPYGDLSAAATNLNEALLAASSGMTVLLDDGQHDVYETVSIPRGVTVRGAGRDRTTIYAAQPFNTVVSINGKDAMLKDVTVAHGRMSESWKYVTSGVEIGSDGGTMADCRVTDCTAGTVGCMDGAVNIKGADAVVTRCLIDGNSVERGAGWNNSCGGIYATAGRIESCVITNNIGSAYKGNASGVYLVGPAVALNCTVLGNRMVNGMAGGGVHAANASSVVRNCIIDGNLSGDGSEVNYFGNGASFSYCLSSDAVPEGSEGCLVGRPVFDTKRPLCLARRTPGRSQGNAVGYEDRLIAATDFFGNPRVKFVSRKGVADIDIGAVESKYAPGGFRITFR